MILRKLNIRLLDYCLIRQLKRTSTKHSCSSISTLARRFKTIEGRVTSTPNIIGAKEKAKEYEADYVAKYERVLAGGGPSGVKRHVMVNKKILPRDRIKMLVDKDSPVLEIAPFAGEDLSSKLFNKCKIHIHT